MGILGDRAVIQGHCYGDTHLKQAASEGFSLHPCTMGDGMKEADPGPHEAMVMVKMMGMVMMMGIPAWSCVNEPWELQAQRSWRLLRILFLPAMGN